MSLQISQKRRQAKRNMLRAQKILRTKRDQKVRTRQTIWKMLLEQMMILRRMLLLK